MNKYQWYINRLKMMTLGEVIRRIIKFLYLRIDEVLFLKKRQRIIDEKFLTVLDKSFVPVNKIFHLADYLDYRRKKIEIKFPLNPYPEEAFVNKLKTLFPQNCKESIKAADEICKHNFRFLGFGPVHLGDEIDWSRSFEKGKSWPMKSWFRINYRHHPELGEIKLLWELSRHQYFLVLGKAYWLTGDEKYAKEFICQLNSWLDNNPPEKGINWIIKLDMGIRMISWVWAYYFFINSKSFNDTIHLKMLRSIYQQTEHIYHNLSFGSSANNHLIGQAAALAVIGIVFWEFKSAKKWVRRGITILSREIEMQVSSEGVDKEQSISYHAFVLDFYLLVITIVNLNKVPVPQSILKKVEKMCEYLMYLKESFDEVPNVGDSDEGQAVKFKIEESQNYQACLSTGAVLVMRDDFKTAVREFDEKSFWLLGLDGWKAFQHLKTAEKRYISRSFSESSYFLMTRREDGRKISLLFDCGLLGLGKPAGHGHADALSFVLALNNNLFIIDPGTYTYNQPPEWRNYFRGTTAHNTLVVDGQNQSLCGGPFIWLKKAKCVVENWECNDNFDLVIGYHDGYLRLPDPVIHRREIRFDKKRWMYVIKDIIEAKELHLIEQYYHFSENCQITEVTNQKFQIERGSSSIYLQVDDQCDPVLFCGQKEPILGWNSKSYGLKCGAYTLKATVQNRGSFELTTTILVGD